MKRWKVECAKPDQSTATIQIDAPDRQSAMRQALARGLKVLSVEERAEPETSAVPPPSPKSPPPNLRRATRSRSDRTRATGVTMVWLGVVAFLPAGCLFGGGMQTGEAAPLALGICVSAISTYLIWVGAIYIAVGRLGIDITEAIERQSATGRAGEGSD